jgi:hypothetical protein
MAKLRSFQILKPESYPTTVISAPVLNGTPQQNLERLTSFVKEFQAKAQKMFDEAGCNQVKSKEDWLKMCPW